MANVSPSHTGFFGGEDLISSGLEMDPGRAQLLWNYYCARTGGYAKVPGYVAYDGSTIQLSFTTGDGTEPSDSEIITVGSISATIVSVTTSTGTWAGGDAAGTIVVNNVYGGSAAPSTGSASFSISTSSTCSIASVSAPAAVPGSGDIKGIWVWDGEVYAVRYTTSKDVLYKATTSGWTACALGYTVAYTAGGGGAAASIPAHGDTLTQGAVTATISGVEITSGNFGVDGDAVGNLYVHTIAGGNFSAAAATYGDDDDDITLSGVQTETVLGTGNRYEFRDANFLAGTDTHFLYGCNGVDHAFQYDGSALVFINTSLSTDTPEHLEVHGQRLWLMQPGGNIIFSAPGNPTTSYSQQYTAGNVALGQEGIGFSSLPGGILAIFGERETKLMKGNISGTGGDMELLDHSRDTGPREWTVQNVGDTLYLSDKGFSSIYQSDKSSGFGSAELSSDIAPVVDTVLGSEIASVLISSKSIYRTFFSSDTADNTFFLTATFDNGRLIGWSRGEYSFDLTCACSGFFSGSEVLFAGSDNGWVYQLETGRNHNGSDMTFGAILAFNNHQDMLAEKRWMRTTLLVDSDDQLVFNWSTQFNFSTSTWQDGSGTSGTIYGGGAYWATGSWSGGYSWGSAVDGTAILDTFGVGYNMALIFSYTDDNTPNHTLRSASNLFTYLRRTH